jgi:hypothetical protein
MTHVVRHKELTTSTKLRGSAFPSPVKNASSPAQDHSPNFTRNRTDMMRSKNILLLGTLLVAVAFGTGCGSLNTAGGDGISQHVVPETGLSAETRAALTKLTTDVPAAASLGQSAKGVLVFPSVVKAGFVVGAFRGEGSLFKKGKLAGYYNTSALPTASRRASSSTVMLFSS